MELYTERLVLREWRETDAGALYRYASDERVGRSAGWPAHKSVEESARIIREVFCAENTFAVCLREEGAIGCIGLMTGEGANMSLKEDEAELGYWIGVPFWGRGLVTEAAAELISYGFEKLGLKHIWCGYFDGNERSRRVQEKCGFVYQKTLKDVPWELTGEVLTEHITMLSRERWQELKKKGEVR